MSIFVQKGGVDCSISDDELRALVHQTIEKSGKTIKKLLLLPPDHTRLNSRAGRITEMIYEDYLPGICTLLRMSGMLYLSLHLYIYHLP